MAAGISLTIFSDVDRAKHPSTLYPPQLPLCSGQPLNSTLFLQNDPLANPVALIPTASGHMDSSCSSSAMDSHPQSQTNIFSLPNELLIQIASQLDTTPPSISKLSHEPSPDLTASPFTPLKQLSLTTWRWRKIVLPILFRYSRIELDKHPQWVPIDARLIDAMEMKLSTLSQHEFQIYTKMRTKFKGSGAFAFDESFDDLLINLCRVQEGDEFLKAVDNVLWLPHLRRSFTHFAAFVSQYDLKHLIKSVVVHTDKEYELRHIATADAPLSRAVSEIWSKVFGVLDPTRLVVAAPPATMAALCDTQMLSSDSWAFDMKMHYLELKTDQAAATARGSEWMLEHMRTSRCRPWNSALVHRRPWTSLAYNEGSSIAAYSTYEYHLKQSPKMLYLLLLRLAKEIDPDCPCNIQSFSFTAVFPFSTNMTYIVRALQRIHTLREVRVRLAPGKENNLLNDKKRMGRAQAGDLWLEWNDSYKVLILLLSQRGPRGEEDIRIGMQDGARFVSDDCNEEARTHEVEEHMHLLRDVGVGWRKVDVGAWERDCSSDEHPLLESAEGV